MPKIIQRILTSLIITAVIYLTIAALLIIFGVPTRDPNTPTLHFDELATDAPSPPTLQSFTARDGTDLPYRHYPAESDQALILLHGSGWHSGYLPTLAAAIADANAAHVYTPDLRGHGESPERRGDIDYIDQLTDDLADLIEHLQADQPFTRLIIGGHSSGGGLVLRFAESQYNPQADAYLLLAPFIQYNAPTTRPNSGGWANAYTGRIIGLTLLNNIGITAFNQLPAIDFNMPPAFRDGTETLAYSFRLNTGYAPNNYKAALQAIDQPLLVIAGADDESFYADQYEPTITQYTAADVVILPNVSHMGAVVSLAVQSPVITWLADLTAQ